jgi:TonB-linked SusC/RagA family outer membrane protein
VQFVPFVNFAALVRGGFVVKRTSLAALVLATLVGASVASAQQRQITGQVKSATGEAVAGANVSITGTAFGAVTNSDGRYTIAAPASAVMLVVRRIAFKRKEVAVPADQNQADVTLEPDVFNLEAVVVTGQATGVERRNAAIATSVVTGSEVTSVPAPAVDRALQGRVPGAYIQQNSGAPGGGTQIQIRGSNTVVGSADPLFVVDGVIVSDASISTGLFTVTASGNPQSTRNDGEKQDDPVNRLTDLNPNDIASIEILRGAAASSIYGSKGVNGVVIITTNRGKAGKPRANIVQRVGFSELQRGFATRAFDTTSAFALYASSGDPAADASARALILSYMVNGKLPNYDHLQEVAGNKPVDYETQLDVSGGSGETRYFLSGNVKGDGGIINNTGAQRQTLRANIDQAFSDRFSIAFSSAFNRTTTQRGFTNNDNNGASITYAIAYIPGFIPIQPVNGVFPNPGITYLSSNPLQNIALGINDETALRFTGGLTATYQAVTTATQNLKLIGAGGIDFFNQKNEVFAPPELFFEANQTNPGVSTLGNADSRFTNWNLNAIHTFTPASGSFKTTTSAGVQWEDRQVSRSRIEAQGLLPGQQNVNQGSVLQSFEELTHERTVGLYGQEEWLGMRERLLLSAGVRAERSSSNGDVNKFYFFPKAAGSYRFPELLGQGSDFKLRAAYGETGNQPLFGQKFTTLQGGQVIGGHVGTVVGNVAGAPDIRPERTREVEAGADATLLGGRATFEVTLFDRRTSDLLVPVTPAPSTGFGLQFLNGGKIKNEGIEIGAGITPVQSAHFNWLFRTTFTSLKNRVLELNLPGGAQGFRPANAGYGLSFGEFFVQVGRPITQIIGVDDNGNVIYLGQANPRFRWSFSNQLTYGRASLSFMWDWQYGGVAQNQTLSLYDCNGLAPDFSTPRGQAGYNACNNTGDARPFVESTSFMKLRNASLSLDLPENVSSWFGARSARVSIEGVNLITITNYHGYDPEVSNYGQQAITRNIDLGPYPPSRSFYFTIQAGF